MSSSLDIASYNAWRKAVADRESARQFLSLIGKRERTTADSRSVEGTFGHLRGVDLTTTIYYQETDGAPNYHKDTAFNIALAAVVKTRFSELAAQAEKVLAEREEEARRTMRNFVDHLNDEVAKAEKTD